MADELHSLLALGLPHRLEDARLGDSAEVVVDSRSPTGLNHVENDGAGETVGLRDALVHTMCRDAWTTEAVTLLVKGVHAERHAMCQQGGAPALVEAVEPVPKRAVLLGQLRVPGLVTLGDRLGRAAVLEVSRLDREEHMPHRGFQARAGRTVLEGVEAELV